MSASRYTAERQVRGRGFTNPPFPPSGSSSEILRLDSQGDAPADELAVGEGHEAVAAARNGEVYRVLRIAQRAEYG